MEQQINQSAQSVTATILKKSWTKKEKQFVSL